MKKEIRNLRKLLRRLPVRYDEHVSFKEDYDFVSGKPKYPRKLIVGIPIECNANWQALCERIWWGKRKRNGNTEADGVD